MWKTVNPNSCGRNVGDCVIRAVSIVLGKTWDDTYIDMVAHGFVNCDMPNSNEVLTDYLGEYGYDRWDILYPTTVKDFASQHRNGKYVLGTGSHVVAVIDGDYYDSWDSGDEMPIYYLIERKNDNMAYPYSNSQPWMPGYGTAYPNTYYSNTATPQPQIQLQPQNSNGFYWVQGDVGAAAYPIAPGQSIILMDSEDSRFFIKSADQFGRPYPLRKFRFWEETAENIQKNMLQSNNNQSQQPAPDTSNFVTKEEFDKKLQEKIDELTR